MATIPDELAARIVAALETIAETIVTFQQQFEERERKFAASKAKRDSAGGDRPSYGARGGFGGEKRSYKPRDNDGGYGSDSFDEDRPRRKTFGDKPAYGEKKAYGDKPARAGAAPKGRDRFSGGGTFRDFDGPKKAGPRGAAGGPKKTFAKKKF